MNTKPEPDCIVCGHFFFNHIHVEGGKCLIPDCDCLEYKSRTIRGDSVMGSVARVHYWKIVNDDTMDSQMVTELITLLEEYAIELSAKEEPLEEGL